MAPGQWNQINKKYPKQVNEKFEKIIIETKLFG